METIPEGDPKSRTMKRDAYRAWGHAYVREKLGVSPEDKGEFFYTLINVVNMAVRDVVGTAKSDRELLKHVKETVDAVIWGNPIPWRQTMIKNR